METQPFTTVKKSRFIIPTKLKQSAKVTGSVLSITLRTLLVIIFIFTAFTVVTSNTDVFFGMRSYTVLTGSMEPTLPVGSVIYSMKNLGYNLGDVITFKTPSGQNVTHRIVSVKNNGEVSYVTKGDANIVVDSAVVTADQVIGKTYFSVPYVGRISAMLKTPQGLFVAVFIPAIIITLFELWSIKKEIEKGVERRLLRQLEQRGVSSHSVWSNSTS